MNIFVIARISIILSAICFLIVLFDVAKHKQKMPIMNIVWPLTMLYGSIVALALYYTIGRGKMAMSHNADVRISWKSIAKSTLHCGSGCTLGDIAAEVFVLLVPVTLFGSRVFGSWLIDYIMAFIIGIAFQYFSIKPMKHLTPGKAIVQSLKADSLSLTFWQIGMYGWMAIAIFCIYKHPMDKGAPVFWFMMQIAMIAGFVTAYPINWWLLKKGIKEPM